MKIEGLFLLDDGAEVDEEGHQELLEVVYFQILEFGEDTFEEVVTVLCY